MNIASFFLIRYFFTISFAISDGSGDDKTCIDILVISSSLVRSEELGLIIGRVCFRAAAGITASNSSWVGIKS